MWISSNKKCIFLMFMRYDHFPFPGTTYMPGNSILYLNWCTQPSNWDSEIVTLLASRNKNLWWVNRYKLHYWEAWLVISLTAAVRGIHSTAASVLSEEFSLHLQRYKRHTRAHYLLFLCPSAYQVPNVFVLFYTLTLCFVSPLSMPVCIFSSWQEQKGRKLMWKKGPAGEVSGRKKGGRAVFFFT